MKGFTKFHQPGTGIGYRPPMDSTIFNWLIGLTSACIVLGGVALYTLLQFI